MGTLKDQAKKNSNWLMVNIGDSSVVKFLDFKVIPNQLDPTKETIQYRLLENGREKYWINSSGKVMLVFDTLVKGEDWVKISRIPWVDKAGKVAEGKSAWVAEKTVAPAVDEVEKEVEWDKEL